VIVNIPPTAFHSEFISGIYLGILMGAILSIFVLTLRDVLLTVIKRKEPSKDWQDAWVAHAELEKKIKKKKKNDKTK